MSDVVKGVEYAAKAHQKEAQEKKKGFKGSTANMSLGGGKSPALDLAVNAAVEAGIHFAVAAGNENQDACNTSPASADKAITVGASTLSDDRAYFSNWGKCVDVFAPGLNILSTYIGSDDATATLSGTSMASPHVAGLLTYFLSLQPGSDSEFFELGQDSLTPQQIEKEANSLQYKGHFVRYPWRHSKCFNLQRWWSRFVRFLEWYQKVPFIWFQARIEHGWIHWIKDRFNLWSSERYSW